MRTVTDTSDERVGIGTGSGGAPPRTLGRLLSAAGLPERAIPDAETASIEVASVEYDSRKAGPGSLFVAVRGLTVDGHDFVADVLARGAGGAMVSAAWWATHPGSVSDVLVVPDPLLALQELARAHRRRRPVPLVAVTGCNGKATTKEMIAAALAPTAVAGAVGALAAWILTESLLAFSDAQYLPDWLIIHPASVRSLEEENGLKPMVAVPA